MFFSSSTTRMVAIVVSAARQLEHEATPPPRFALDVDAATVRLHDVPDDREAEPGRPDLPAVRGLGEALEDPLALLGRDAGAGVRDRDQHRTGLRGRVDT